MKFQLFFLTNFFLSISSWIFRKFLRFFGSRRKISQKNSGTPLARQGAPPARQGAQSRDLARKVATKSRPCAPRSPPSRDLGAQGRDQVATKSRPSRNIIGKKFSPRKIFHRENFFSRKIFAAKIFSPSCSRKKFYPKKPEFLKILHSRREFSKIPVFWKKIFPRSVRKIFRRVKFFSEEKIFAVKIFRGEIFPIRLQ